MSDQFQAKKSYQDYEMYFLKKPITYTLADEVELISAKFSMKMEKLSDRDTDLMNMILFRMNPHLQINKTFINTTNTMYLDNEGVSINFLQARKWNLTININGFKVKNNLFSPVWNIAVATLCN